jgi:PAS domain S-box-containing protein
MSYEKSAAGPGRNPTDADWRKRLVGLLFAIAISVLTLQARRALTPWLYDQPVLIFFILPIFFSACVGGLWAGLLSTAICGWGTSYFLFPKVHDPLFSQNSAGFWQWVVLIIIGALVCLLAEAMHRARARTEATCRQLAESQALYHSLVDQVPAGIFRKDATGRYVFVNRFFCQLWGCPSEYFLGKLPAELAPACGQLPAGTAEQHDQIMRTDKTIEVMEDFTLQDGRKLHLHLIEWPVFGPHGQVVGSQGILFDVTQRKLDAEALARSVALLRTTTEATINGLLVEDNNHRITIFNSRILEIMDIPRNLAESADATAVAELAKTRVSDPEAFLRRIQEVVAKPQLPSFDILTLKNGRVIERVSHPQQLGDKIIGRVWSFRDVTDQRRSEQAVIEREQLLRQVIDLVPHFIFAKDSQSRLLLANRAMAEACGLTAEQMTGRSDIEFAADLLQAKAFIRDDREVMESGRPKFIPEERFTRKDGRVITLETYKIPFTNPGRNGPSLLGVAVDITERRAAEQQLKQMAVMLESSDEAISSINLAGIITSWNRGAETIFGYSAVEIIGSPDQRLYLPDQLAERDRVLDQIGRGEGFKRLQTERLRKDGKRIRILATISPLRDARGIVVGAATIASDVTRQQLLEEQLRQSQKMEAIGLLAGGVAHDFNNILAVIQMQIELAHMDSPFTSAQEACLQEIETAAKRGANLTRQLLLFSRRQRLQPREVDLGDAIINMTKMLRRILGEDIRIQFKYASQPLFVQADAGMIDQVLMNLTLNSRDAMPHGGHLIIETTAVEMDELAVMQSSHARPGSFVRLSISDTGCGIPHEILPRIFEPFFTTKDVGKGTGLGLATVFSIVQQHQGWINVSSEPGCGTTFDIYFPRLVKNPAQMDDAPAALTAIRGGQETILLVEDDDSLRASVQHCLAGLGYNLLEAATGVAALRLWHDHRQQIDLLVTDLVMPDGMSGKELAEQLRRDKPQLNIIFVSGYNADLLTGDIQRDPRAKFLAKPFPAQALAHTVRASLDQK